MGNLDMILPPLVFGDREREKERERERERKRKRKREREGESGGHLNKSRSPEFGSFKMYPNTVASCSDADSKQSCKEAVHPLVLLLCGREGEERRGGGEEGGEGGC